MTTGELLRQIRFAHEYTRRLLDATPLTDWWKVPSAGISHIAWQVGHLATAAYRLGLERIRGRQPGDELLMGEALFAAFTRESNPDPDPAAYPPLDEILGTYERVHARIQEELPDVSAEQLDLPVIRPHPVFTTRRGSLLWCSQHELTHAGQIGLLRRQLGHAPLW